MPGLNCDSSPPRKFRGGRAAVVLIARYTRCRCLLPLPAATGDRTGKTGRRRPLTDLTGLPRRSILLLISTLLRRINRRYIGKLVQEHDYSTVELGTGEWYAEQTVDGLCRRRGRVLLAVRSRCVGAGRRGRLS